MDVERESGGGPPPGESWKAWAFGLGGLAMVVAVLAPLSGGGVGPGPGNGWLVPVGPAGEASSLPAGLAASAGLPAEPLGLALLLALAALGVALELTSVELPGFGFFSPAFALYFALALQPGPGLPLAALAALAGLALRTAFRGHVLWYWRVREAVGDLFPVGAGLAVLHFVQVSGVGVPLLPLEARLPAVVLAIGAYVFSALTVPGLFVGALGRENAMSWGIVRERLWSQILGVAFAGVLVAVLVRLSPWLALAGAPLLLALHRAAELGAFWARVEERRRLERRLDATRDLLAEAEVQKEQTWQRLALKVDEVELLHSLARQLAGCESVYQAAKAVVQLARRLVPSQTVAVFLHREEGLVPVAQESPHSDLLSSVSLLRVREPVVDRAWREGRPLLARVDEMRNSRLIGDERSRLAVPIPGQGVLYAGQQRPDGYTEQHIQMLGIVCGQAALALQSAARYESQQQALGLHAEAHGRLESWARQLDRLLSGLREFLSVLDPQTMLQHLGSLLEVLAPHEARSIMVGRRPGESPGLYKVEAGDIEAGAVEELATAVMRSGLPLLLEDVGASRFQAPGPGLRSVLAVPMNTDQGALGAFVLASREQEAFSREHQDLAFMLAYQAGAAFVRAHLHHELREAHQQLQESQAQVIQSSKMAAVGQLAAGVAHELNTPLGAVLLGIDSAASRLESRPDQAASRLQTARKALLQARETVSKLLFYSRDARHGFREVSVNRVVEDTLELIGHQLRLDGVEVETDLGEVPVILANQSEVQQVLTNLVLNARDAIQEGGGTPWVAIRSRSDGTAVVLEVEDRGPGMAPELRDRIFEPFFTTRPVGKGTGLGLSVSLEIVRRHGGTLEVDSEPGRGTRFTVTFPGPEAAQG